MGALVLAITMALPVFPLAPAALFLALVVSSVAASAVGSNGLLLGPVSRAAQARNAGLAVGIVGAGASLGQLVLGPVMQGLIDTQGWRVALLALWCVVRALRRRRLETPGLLRACIVAGPLGVVALEAGWLVTEYGRQPWVVRGALRTADAVTSFSPLAPTFAVFTAVYVGLAAAVVYLLGRQIAGSIPRAGREAGVPDAI